MITTLKFLSFSFYKPEYYYYSTTRVMFYFLSKALYYAVMPISMLFIFLMYAFYTKNIARKKKVIRFVIVLLYFGSIPFIANELMLAWEIPPTPLSKMKRSYEVGIILSGVVNNFKSPHDRVYISQGADRIFHTVELYNKGIVKHILVTGAYSLVLGESKNEAEDIKKILLMCGVPEYAITIEGHARNTRENALFSAPILNHHFPGKRYLLITSAFHMRRAKGCFNKLGIDVDCFSTDFYTYDRTFRPFGFIPSEEALETNQTLVHEIIGYIVYNVFGYI